MKKLLVLLAFVFALSANAQNYIIEQPVTNLVNPSDFVFVAGIDDKSFGLGRQRTASFEAWRRLTTPSDQPEPP